MSGLAFIEPQWPAPRGVRAVATTRAGGVSVGPYASLNLGAHVGDDPGAVAENRRRLKAALDLRSEPCWLQQVHGNAVVEARVQSQAPVADAAVAHDAERVCVVLTADCLPVLFCNRQGTCVGAAHAGWRGLAGGVLGATVKAMDVLPSSLLAWLGPAIEQEAFEVGGEVRDQFITLDAANAAAFVINERGRWQADLYGLARRQLLELGVGGVYGGDFRCYAEPQHFFSYRRDSVTGRLATMVWLRRVPGT